MSRVSAETPTRSTPWALIASIVLPAGIESGEIGEYEGWTTPGTFSQVEAGAGALGAVSVGVGVGASPRSSLPERGEQAVSASVPTSAAMSPMRAVRERMALIGTP